VRSGPTALPGAAVEGWYSIALAAVVFFRRYCRPNPAARVRNVAHVARH
jgi:hypothetical protein